MKIKLLSLILLLSAYSYSQTGFRPGYVITQNGDTLRGEIFFRSVQDMCTLCTFKTENRTLNYSASEIAGFRFIDGKYFVSKKIKDHTFFLEFLVKGKVSVYFSTDKYADHYYIEKDSLGLAELPYKEYFKIKGNNEVLIKSKKHIGLLTYFMQDAPGLSTEILALKTPDEKNMIDLAKKYHKAVCNDNNCIVYENVPPEAKVNLEVAVGTQNFPGFSDYENRSYLTTQILAHIWLPRLSENIFIKTGIKCTWLASALIQIPIQVEYVLPFKVIQPKLGFGVTLYPADVNTMSFYPITSAMLGVNIKLNKKYFISVNYDVDFITDYFINIKGFGSHTFTLGINKTF